MAFYSLKDIEIFTVLELGVLLAQDPCQHLARLHTRPHHVAVLVPVRIGAVMNTLKLE